MNDTRKLDEFPLPKTHESVLSHAQVYHFLEHGYLQVSGLIPRATSAAAETAMWRLLGRDPADPATWPGARRDTFTDDPALLAMYTPPLLTAVGQLASSDPHLFPVSRVPLNAYILTVPPTPEPWHDSGGHFDGTGNLTTHIVCTWPHPWRLFAMIYLHDVASQGGATLVWPGSHRRAEALLRSCPERYRFMGQLREDVAMLDLGAPLELPGQAGDVIFCDQLLYHAGSSNAGQRPRFAMNMKW